MLNIIFIYKNNVTVIFHRHRDNYSHKIPKTHRSLLYLEKSVNPKLSVSARDSADDPQCSWFAINDDHFYLSLTSKTSVDLICLQFVFCSDDNQTQMMSSCQSSSDWQLCDVIRAPQSLIRWIRESVWQSLRLIPEITSHRDAAWGVWMFWLNLLISFL